MNYNTIRLWTGCVTDDEFYDYCDKVRRLRNHASIAVWCGANECRKRWEVFTRLAGSSCTAIQCCSDSTGLLF